jgi:hypothetical protein
LSVLAPILLIISALIYFLPTIVASSRQHPSGCAIVVVNLFLGWTLVGWVVALAWALSHTPESSESARQLPVQVQAQSPQCPRCNGELDGTPEVCRHCRTELEWIRHKAFTHEQAAIERERLLQEEHQRQQSHIESERRLEESRQMACKRHEERLAAVSATAKWFCFTVPQATWTHYNTTIRKAVGDENDLLFHFFRWLGVSFVAVVVILLGSRLFARSSQPGLPKNEETNQARAETPPSGQKQPAAKPVAPQWILYGSDGGKVIVTTTRQVQEKLMAATLEAANTGEIADSTNLADMLGSGQIFYVPSGTGAIVIQNNARYSQVRIRSGTNAGRTGWVLSQVLRSAN